MRNDESDSETGAETPSPSDVAVDAWFTAHFHNLGAQLDTEVYNRLHAAKEDLKVRLRGAPSPQ